MEQIPNKYFSHIMELLYTLKVGEIMESNVICVKKDSTIGDVKNIFKQTHITGSPVVDNDNNLVGIISMSDLLEALYSSGAADSVEKWMTSTVVTIHAEVNIVKGLDLLNKHNIGRVPVISDSKKVIGILTNGIILKNLLLRMDKFSEKTEKEVIELSSKLNLDEIKIDKPMQFKWALKKNDFTNAGKLSSELKKILNKKNIDRVIVRRISIATYEAEMNMIIHSEGGYAYIDINSERIKEDFIDNGPGIESIELAMKEGYSTAPAIARELGFGAGMGLPNINKSVDVFTIESSVPSGTKLTFEVFFDPTKSKKIE